MLAKKGYSLSIFPTSWQFGKVKIRDKTVFAIGPFRYSIHKVNGSLKDYAS